MIQTIYHFLKKNRLMAIFVAVLVWAIFGFWATRLSIQEDISKTFPQDSSLHRYQDFYKKSPLASKVIIAIGGENELTTAEKIELGQSLKLSLDSSTTSLIDTIEFEMSTNSLSSSVDYFYQNLPFFLSVEEMGSALAKGQEEANQKVQGVLSKLMTPEGYGLRKYLMRDPAGLYHGVLDKLSGFKQGSDFQLEEGHLFTEDGKYVLMLITPGFPASESKNNGLLVQKLKEAAASVEKGEVLLFGGPVIAAANANQIKDDTTVAGIVAVVLILVLLLWYYRKLTIPIVFFLPPLFGITVALGTIYLLKGEISIVTIGAGSIVLGIALDYCFHTFTHIKHARSVGDSLKEISWPLILSCFTTVLAFLSLLFLKSEILGDFGLLASFSLIGTLLFVLLILPLLVDSLKLKESLSSGSGWLDKVLSQQINRPQIIVALIVGITVFLGFFISKVSFEDDLNKINYFPEELQRAEQAITTSETTEKTIYVVSEASTIQQAIDQNYKLTVALDSLQKEGLVNSLVSVNHLFPTTAQAQLRAKNWNSKTSLKDSLIQRYQSAGLESGIREEGFGEFYNLLNQEFSKYSVSKELFSQGMFSNLILMDEDKVGVINVVNTYPENVAALELVGERTGGMVVDKSAMATSLISVVKDNFNLLLLVTTSLVFITLLINYGRIELALLTFLPMVLSWFWILGLCGLFDIKFNFVNVLVTTFIFGLGDDFCIFVTDGLLSRFKLGINKLRSYQSSIILSTTTTIIGTGVLLFAKHPALSSIATLSVIGMVCISFISLTVQPLIFRYTVEKRKEKRRQPLTLFILITSVISFGYFVFGSLVMTAMVPLFFIFPASKKLKRKWFNFLISKFGKSVIYLMVNVKKSVHNPHGETFEKPAIIVANHQSFIDILVMIMLKPRIVILTKEWVWRSPLFGWVVRYAGFPTAVNELDENEDYIKECLENGYSVAIFPEGTRSEDGKIKRFHKGAFYLAEKYQVDIIPILLHGLDYTIRKSGFILLSGEINIQILPRIVPSDLSFGKDYRERAKLVGRYMREEFEKMVLKYEDVDYYHDAVLANYIYKGPVLEWYVRIKMYLEKNFRLFEENVPKQGKIVDMGCGYGYLSYMLYFTGKERQILGLDYDEEKIEVAQNSFAKNDQIKFETTNLANYNPVPADCYIIKDVLHYLKQDERKQLLEKCFQNLNEGGRMLVRDGFIENKGHESTRFTEHVSTKLVGFNKTQNDLDFFSKTEIEDIAARFGMTCKTMDEGHRTSNQTLLIKKAKP